MKPHFSFLMFLTFFCIISIGLLHGHGIAESTPVKTPKGFQSIETIKPREKIIAYNIKLKQELKTSVRTTGYSISNCYVRIRLHTPEIIEHEDILCTPTQEFYRLIDGAWIPAAQLNIGDVLRSNTNGSLAVTHIELINKPLNVYILEVKKYHNFFIGKHALLTHNTMLPWEVAIGISIPIGEAATGGAAGSFFGPVGVVGGIIVGSLLGCGLRYLTNQDKIYQYDAFFDAETINALIKGSLKNSSQPKNTPSGNRPSNPQDPKNNDDKKRITNDVPKSEFFKKISDRYEHWRDGIYRAKRSAEKLGDGKAEFLRWDHLHNDVEAYSKTEKHLGSINPKTLELYKEPVPYRNL